MVIEDSRLPDGQVLRRVHNRNTSEVSASMLYLLVMYNLRLAQKVREKVYITPVKILHNIWNVTDVAGSKCVHTLQ